MSFTLHGLAVSLRRFERQVDVTQLLRGRVGVSPQAVGSVRCGGRIFAAVQANQAKQQGAAAVDLYLQPLGGQRGGSHLVEEMGRDGAVVDDAAAGERDGAGTGGDQARQGHLGGGAGKHARAGVEQ